MNVRFRHPVGALAALMIAAVAWVPAACAPPAAVFPVFAAPVLA